MGVASSGRDKASSMRWKDREALPCGLRQGTGQEGRGLRGGVGSKGAWLLTACSARNSAGSPRIASAGSQRVTLARIGSPPKMRTCPHTHGGGSIEKFERAPGGGSPISQWAKLGGPKHSPVIKVRWSPTRPSSSVRIRATCPRRGGRGAASASRKAGGLHSRPPPQKLPPRRGPETQWQS